MMGLVDKLRNYADRYADNDADRLLINDAADEIERLRKENRHYQDAIGQIISAAKHPAS